MDRKQKDEPAPEREAILIVGGGTMLSDSVAKMLIEESKVIESAACQPLFDPPENNRAAHIQKRIERKQYRQWEQNLRSKMRARVR